MATCATSIGVFGSAANLVKVAVIRGGRTVAVRKLQGRWRCSSKRAVARGARGSSVRVKRRERLPVLSGRSGLTINTDTSLTDRLPEARTATYGWTR